jgi:glyoxylase-like metal-dependent hydrolase (beta-lactamase superfamily II)
VHEGGVLRPAFENAEYVIQRGEWENAVHPNERTKGSYLAENFLPLEEAGHIRFIEGDAEVTPGVKCVLTGGHTEFHQVVFIESDGARAVFLADLIPTTAHLNRPYIMGYDLFPMQTLERKKELLPRVLEEKWLMAFMHDPEVAFAYLTEAKRGYGFETVERISK